MAQMRQIIGDYFPISELNFAKGRALQRLEFRINDLAEARGQCLKAGLSVDVLNEIYADIILPAAIQQVRQ